MEGWTKLHRKFLEWEWFSKPEMVQLFIYFLLKANYEPKQFQGISLGVGQLLTTNPQIQKDTGLTEQQVRTCVKRLISTDEITYQATGKKVLITICKYDSYQLSENKINGISNEINNGSSTDEQRVANGLSTDIQRSKEINNNILLTRERDRFDDRKDYLLNRAFWVENNLRVHKLELSEFKEWLDKFFDMLRCGGKTDIEEDEAAMYASNWIRDQISKQNKKQKQNGTNKQTTGSGKGGQPSSVRVRVAEIP